MPRILTQSDIAEFRERLCRVAVQLFAEVGHEGFNMRTLAKRVGVSAMTPYRYFRDKDEILALLEGQAFARLAERLEAAAGLSRTLQDRRAAICRAYLRFVLEEETSYRLMFDVSRPGCGAIKPAEGRIQVILSDIESEEGDGDDHLGWRLWAKLHGIIALFLAGRIDERRMAALVENDVIGSGRDINGSPSTWAGPALKSQTARQAIAV